MQVTALEPSGAEGSARIDGLVSHNRELFNENRRFEYQFAMDRVGKECHDARDVESMEAISEKKFNLATTKEALSVPGDQASADRLVMSSSIEDQDHVQS